MQIVKIGDRSIGPGHPCYLIAEVGTTCLGDMDKAVHLIDAAADAGMDAVKFQVIDPSQLSDNRATYPIRVKGETTQLNMREMFERLSFSTRDWAAIASHCRSRQVEFFATVDFPAGVDLLESLGVNVHKIGAWDSTFRPLIERIGRTGKPMFADLGPTTPEEADDIVRWYKGAGGSAVLLMHDFHTEDDTQMNLRAIQALRQRYPWPSGFSSPALDHDLDIAALGLGAAYLEKRLILSRSEAAFHAHESCEPHELKEWVERIRHVERALGVSEIAPSDKDLEGKKKYYRSVCTLSPVAAGERFTRDNLGGKRPGTGLPTDRLEELWGRVARRDLPADHLLNESDCL